MSRLKGTTRSSASTSPEIVKRRQALFATIIVIGTAAALCFAVAAFVMDPRLKPSGVEIDLAGIPLLTIPYDDIDQVRVRTRASVYFSGNPFRRLRVGGCLRDDVVELTRRHGWMTSVVVCPRDRAGFVREVEARRRRPRLARMRRLGDAGRSRSRFTSRRL
jgi:hypothetical protein